MTAAPTVPGSLYPSLAGDPRVSVHMHERNQGKGAAIRTAAAVADRRLRDHVRRRPGVLAGRDPLAAGAGAGRPGEVVYGTRTFGSHNAYSYAYVLGNKGVTTVRERAVQLLHQRPRDLLQADPGRPVPRAGHPRDRVRHGGRGHRQAAAARHTGPTRCRSATRRAPGRPGRNSPGATASRRCGSCSANGSGAARRKARPVRFPAGAKGPGRLFNWLDPPARALHEPRQRQEHWQAEPDQQQAAGERARHEVP